MPAKLYIHYNNVNKNKQKTYKQKPCLVIASAPEQFTVSCSPLYVGTGVKGELARSHSTTKPNTQSTSDKYAD